MFEEGILDAGLDRTDWIMENGSDWCVRFALRQTGPAPVNGSWPPTIPPLKGHGPKGKRIATTGQRDPGLFKKKGSKVAGVLLGSDQAKAPELVDAIVELTETGSSRAPTTCASWTWSWSHHS